jgi:hypothetical protein
MRLSIGLTVIGVAALSGFGGAPLPFAAPAWAASAPKRMGGTWDISWKSRRGLTRNGTMTLEQRGTELSARIEDRGGITATGSIAGSDFTLRGYRMALPFTVTGRVQGRKMTGALQALGIERPFTGVRRRGR